MTPIRFVATNKSIQTCQSKPWLLFWFALANFVSLLTVRSFNTNDILACECEFTFDFFPALQCVCVLCVHETDQLVIRQM